jgi:hypothetical protein
MGAADTQGSATTSGALAVRRFEDNRVRHVVMFSGGIGSWAAASRVIERHGRDDVVLLFADVGGDRSNEHEAEDADTYRFINDAAVQLGVELVTVKDGRTVWQVYRDRRYLGNSRLAVCSHELKQKPTRRWLEEHCAPASTVVYVGIDWLELHRLGPIQERYRPYRAEAPMTEPPYIDKAQMIAAAKQAGLTPPRAYAAGYPHNNCGGFCCRAGQAQFRLLLRQNPERFAYHEREEQEFRQFLGKDVSILRDWKNDAKPLTLHELRKRVEADEQLSLFDEFEFGGCGCFTDPEEPS